MGATPQEVGQEILTQSMVTLDTNTFGSLDMKLQSHEVVFENSLLECLQFQLDKFFFLQGIR